MATSFTLSVRDLSLQNAKVFMTRIERTFSMEFQVRCSASASIVEVSQYLFETLPWNLGDYGNSEAILETYSCKPDDPNTLLIYKGTASYRQSDYGELTTTIEFSSNKYEEVMYTALDPNNKKIAVLNSAGDRFADPLKEVNERQVIKVSKFYLLTEFSPTTIAQYRNTVNLNAIRIADVSAPARGMWMQSLIPKIQVFSPEEYGWRFDMEIEVRGEGKTYDREVLNAGMYYLESSSSPSSPDSTGLVRMNNTWYRRVRARTQDPDTGKIEPSQEPVLLTKAGGRLQDTTPGNEVYLQFQTKPKADWAPLNLPRTVWEVVSRG